MSHQDQKHICRNASEIQAVLTKLLPASVIEFRRHGNATIPAQTLVCVAMIAWGWLSTGTIDDRVGAAFEILTRTGRGPFTASRQGMMKALASCTEALLPLMIRHLTDLVQGFKGLWSAKGKVNIAADETKFLAPRTVANQMVFSAEKIGKTRHYATEADRAKAATVQVHATVLWHLGSGLPLNWRLGGSASSERKNVVEMLPEMPDNARIVGDAEFIGDPLWRALIDSKRTFIVRVGSNVTLLKHLGELQFSEGYVYFWTDKAQRNWQHPLTLRLIQIDSGRHPIYLITNDLNIEDEEVRTIYRQRWGVEVFFRTVKQSAQRRKLSCLTPENVRTELQWTLLGLWAALFLGQESFRENKLPREDPPRPDTRAAVAARCGHSLPTASRTASSGTKDRRIKPPPTQTQPPLPPQKTTPTRRSPDPEERHRNPKTTREETAPLKSLPALGATAGLPSIARWRGDDRTWLTWGNLDFPPFQRAGQTGWLGLHSPSQATAGRASSGTHVSFSHQWLGSTNGSPQTERGLTPSVTLRRDRGNGEILPCDTPDSPVC